jgi:hypothetical protein
VSIDKLIKSLTIYYKNTINRHDMSKEKTKTIRHEANPFVEGMELIVGSKAVKVATVGKEKNILVNQHTGEVTGTHVVARKKVDSTKFVKVFANYMSFTFDLTKGGNKALRVLLWALKEYGIGRDKISLDKYALEEFLAKHADLEPKLILSYATFARGLAELEKAKLIAKAIKPGDYFINPDVIFNGDRIAFTTVLERKAEEQKELDLDNKDNQ